MKTLIKKLKLLLLCVFGFHRYYKWHPYPNVHPECKIDRCEYCDYYEWR